MDNASKNATDMIQRLQMQYNRGRQAAITNELVDIITGKLSIVTFVSCVEMEVLCRCQRSLGGISIDNRSFAPLNSSLEIFYEMKGKDLFIVGVETDNLNQQLGVASQP
jgi:hypothetical protein